MELPLPDSAEELIKQWLTENRYTFAWLARETNIDETYLHQMIKGYHSKKKGTYIKKPLLPKYLVKINNRLGTKFKLND